MSKIKLLEILSTVPYPVQAGGTMALFSMIDQLRKHMDINILFLLTTNEREKLKALQELWPEVKFYVYTPSKNKRFFLQKLGEHIYAKGVFENDCLRYYVSPFSKYSPEIINRIVTTASEVNPDIIQTEFYPSQDYVYAFPGNVKKVFVQHEIHYVVNRMLLNAHGMGKNHYALAAYDMLKAEEIAAMNQYDMVLTLNDADAERMKNDGVTTEVESSPVGVVRARERNKCSYSGKLIFIGAGGHTPNVEAVKWFTDNIWTKIMHRYPETEFHIVGKWSESLQKEFSEVPNLLFDGFVDNLGKALEGGITVVPILSGSGIRMKILDAVNYGVPFISTTIGALDMGFEDGRDCYIADTPQDFSDKLIRMMESPELREKFYTNSLKVYAEKYSPEGLAQKRLGFYKKLLSR